ncbi:MAG: hypothetical protein Q7K43_02765, partial [Candidatus Woesearchaeota archaeon]|nr:hypothetical protein [Candidatus Woesearchaeota archaeon]
MNETDIIAAIKAKDSTEPEAEQNLLIRQKEIWENAIARTASRLERDGTPLSQDQIKYLEAVPSELVFDRLIELQVREAALQTQAIAEKPNLQTGELKAKAFSAIKEALVSTTETNESAIQPLQRERVARAITDNLEIDQILTNEARWSEAIDRAAIQLRLGPEQVSYLKTIPSEVVLEQIARSITEETAAQKQDQGTLFTADTTGLNQKIIPLIEEALKPTQSSRVKAVVAQMAPLVFVNTQPELSINPKTASVKSIMVVQVKIQQEAILSLSQIAPALVEKGVILTPIETAKVLAAFSLTESEVRVLLKTPFLTKGPIDKAVIFQTKEIGPI